MKHRAWNPGIVLAVAAVLLASASFAQDATAVRGTSCLACHGDADLFDAESLEIIDRFEKGIHAAVGLSCHDCHGGNPFLETAEDLDLAMDVSFAPNPYRGAPESEAVTAFCGRCHSDPEYMKRFNPDLRVDQEREYWTSQHGRSLGAGNTKVATCIDCHGVHGILAANNPDSPVYPTEVAETCRSCHSDREYMAGSVLADGRPLPTDQYAHWRRSVHAESLLDRGDLSAPTCNDCHGNHGAAPPGIESIAFVCGRCHGREARLFRASRKHQGLQQHNEYLSEAADEGCRACHEAPEPQAALTAVNSLAECTICHENHAVVRATSAILAGLPETPCAFCHEGSGALSLEVPEPDKTAQHYQEVKADLLAKARDEGVTTDLFNYLVDETLVLPDHTLLPEGAAEPDLRPGFRRLFEKFRVGKTYYTYEDPDSGEVLRTEIYRCSRCHAPDGISTSGGPAGLETAKTILERMQELTSVTARAERNVLAARRGGVETRGALEAIDAAVDAQISLEVLTHTFETAEGSAFAEKHQEGLDSARVALAASQGAMDELGSRRQWLTLFLAFTVLVAIGVALKIREISIRERRSEESG